MASLQLDAPIPVLESGDEFTIEVLLDNPDGIAIGGYQIAFGFDTTRYEDFSCNGGIARTPNVDAVARRGMRYTNSIVTSPRTSPSIATFMTGRVPHRRVPIRIASGGLMLSTGAVSVRP